jgi:hypothetical protein
MTFGCNLVGTVEKLTQCVNGLGGGLRLLELGEQLVAQDGIAVQQRTDELFSKRHHVLCHLFGGGGPVAVAEVDEAVHAVLQHDVARLDVAMSYADLLTVHAHQCFRQSQQLPHQRL